MKNLKIVIISLFVTVTLLACSAQTNVIDSSKTSTNPETKTPPKTEQTEAEADTEAKAEVEVEVEAKAEAETETETEEESKTEPEIDFEEVVDIPYDEEDPQYVDYTDESYSILITNKPFVLFFHADWCHTCQRLETDITAALESFPKGTKILKVDFDKVKHLREDYNVVLQSTFIVLNEEGTVISRLSVPTNAQLIEAITNSL